MYNRVIKSDVLKGHDPGWSPVGPRGGPAPVPGYSTPHPAHLLPSPRSPPPPQRVIPSTVTWTLPLSLFISHWTSSVYYHSFFLYYHSLSSIINQTMCVERWCPAGVRVNNVPAVWVSWGWSSLGEHSARHMARSHLCLTLTPLTLSVSYSPHINWTVPLFQLTLNFNFLTSSHKRVILNGRSIWFRTV